MCNFTCSLYCIHPAMNRSGGGDHPCIMARSYALKSLDDYHDGSYLCTHAKAIHSVMKQLSSIFGGLMPSDASKLQGISYYYDDCPIFESSTLLKSGTYGNCYRVKVRPLSLQFSGLASDTIILKWLKEPGSSGNLIRELAYLQFLLQVGHPNIVRPVVRTIQPTNEKDTLVVINRDSLACAIAMEPVLNAVCLSDAAFAGWSDSEKFFCFVQIADCLNFLHAYGIYHWDLHDGNIMITDDKLPVIIDLGSCAHSTAAQTESHDDMKAFWNLLLSIFSDESECLYPVNEWYTKSYNDFYGELPLNMNDVCIQLGDCSLGQLIDCGLVGGNVQARYFLPDKLHEEHFAAMNPIQSYTELSARYHGAEIRIRQKETIENYYSSRRKVADSRSDF